MGPTQVPPPAPSASSEQVFYIDGEQAVRLAELEVELAHIRAEAAGLTTWTRLDAPRDVSPLGV